MSWKKNVISYVLWLVYTLFTGVVLISLASDITGGTVNTAIVAVGILGAAAILVLLLHFFDLKLSSVLMEKQGIWNAVQAAVAVVLLAVGIVLRVQAISGAAEDSVYFELAAVLPNQKVPQIVHGAVYLYVSILHTLFYFLGNKLLVAVWFQIVLQVLCGLFLYCVVRRVSGPLAALVTLGIFMCSPVTIEKAVELSPELLFLLPVLLVAWGMTGSFGKNLNKTAAFFLGILTGALGYLDVSGFFLLFVLAAVVCAQKEEGSGKGAGARAGAFFLGLLGAAVGFLGCIVADASMSGKNSIRVLKAWGVLYRPENIVLYTTGEQTAITWEDWMLMVLLAMGIFSFWLNRRQDKRSVYTIGICLWMTATGFGIFTPELIGNTGLYLLLLLWGTVSLEECRSLPAAAGAVEEAAVPEGTTVSKKAAVMEKTDALEEADVRERAATLEKTVEIEKVEVLPEEEMSERKEHLAEQEESLTEEKTLEKKQPKKVQYIENPLPLPKKHVKRVMDYSLKEMPDEDDFDLDIGDEDDFDY